MTDPDPRGALAMSRREALALTGAASLAMASPAPAESSAAAPSQPVSLLYPHESPTRATRDLSGLWRFRLDPEGNGEAQRWFDGLRDTRMIPVPCSWNDLFDDARNYTDAAWYETSFQIDPGWRGRRVVLRFGSAVYRAKVWLNGQSLGEHLGGHLPFAFDCGAAGRFGEANRLTVLVENSLRLDRVPAIPDPVKSRFWVEEFPQTSYDFFPYSGLHRPVLLCALPPQHVSDVTVVTTREGRTGLVDVAVTVSGGWSGAARVTLSGGERPISAIVAISRGKGRGTVRVPAARLWSPDDPFLYQLDIALGADGVLDSYRLDVGIRTIKVDGERLLLNGEPLQLRGFGKHEDFLLHGRGLDLAVLVRDFELLKWIGANSFRTSHYPYSEEAMMLADRYGFLVIAELPGVSLTFSDADDVVEARRVQLRAAASELVRRDRNHPCIIFWSIANEPLTRSFHLYNDAAPDAVAKGTRFFADIFAHMRSLDATRAVALVSVHNGPPEWVGQGDLICTNSYNGWYAVSGKEAEAEATLEKEVLALHARHPGKPIIFTEFGADAVAGIHDEPPAMWSEEYQSELIELYLRVLRRHSFVIGAHPWAFADFRTSQSTMRVDATNFKGVFTRDRRPKLAAHALRRTWFEKTAPG
ncbi:beta-glucuronidase [Sphingomonas sp. PAMC 26621]|uniref:beta-glucuronidase n=1 Tax=Sphingomonas sp. PAMC 26621 TaxID=1112213 RepID=UPI000289AD5B|nr:beta-glucuronidase [Sphingomonas sp. PAMC 26621]